MDTDGRRRTNLALLFLTPFAVLTGLVSNTIGVDWTLDPAVIHSVAAMAVVAIAPWKSIVIRLESNRRRPTRWVSYLLLALTLTTIASGLIHATDATDRIGPLTVMQIHVGGGLVAIVLLTLHYRSHPVTPRPRDLSRRAALRGLGLTGIATLLWAGWEQGLNVLEVDGADRRFTGSHERSSFDQRGMPVTQWFDDRVQLLDRDEWALDVNGTALGYSDVVSLSGEDVEAILDCTSGWYSLQRWKGVRLSDLVDHTGGRSIEIRSATGYARRFPTRDLERLWLVTHVNGEPLTPGHGFPARIVAPGRRGFWWVKWVVAIRTSDVPWWVQLPFPTT